MAVITLKLRGRVLWVCADCGKRFDADKELQNAVDHQQKQSHDVKGGAETVSSWELALG